MNLYLTVGVTCYFLLLGQMVVALTRLSGFLKKKKKKITKKKEQQHF